MRYQESFRGGSRSGKSQSERAFGDLGLPY